MEIRLYGKLSSKFEEKDLNSKKIGTKKISISENKKIKKILENLGIKEDEVSHIFLDGEYSDVERIVRSDSERLAVFPKDMGLLYTWYFNKKK